MKMSDKIRERFEEWFFAFDVHSSAKERAGHGYKSMAAEAAWRAFEAGALAMTTGEVLP